MPHGVELVAGTGFVLQGQPQHLQEALQVQHGHARDHPTLASPGHLCFQVFQQRFSHLSQYLSNANNIYIYVFYYFYGEERDKKYAIVLGVRQLQGLRTESSTHNFWTIVLLSFS